MTRRELLEALAYLESATGRSITSETADVWFDQCGDLTKESFQAGVRRAVAEYQYAGFPPIGVVRRLALESVHGLPMTPEDAYARLREAQSRFGYTGTQQVKTFLGPEICQVVYSIGGWQRLSDSPISEQGTIFAQFRDAYQRQTGRTELLRRLPSDMRPKLCGTASTSGQQLITNHEDADRSENSTNCD